MDELLKELTLPGAGTHPITAVSLLLVLGLSFLLCSLLSRAYLATHSGISYSKSFTQTIVLMGVTIAVVMLIVGSNIARAFSLVGALSIVRFRTAMKEPRDIAFIFMSMAIGMACGTGFYAIALVSALAFTAFVRLLHRADFGARPFQEVLLKIQTSAGAEAPALLRVFDQFLERYTLISVDSLEGGAKQERIYEVRLKPKVSTSTLVRELAETNGGAQVNILPRYDQVDL